MYEHIHLTFRFMNMLKHPTNVSLVVVMCTIFWTTTSALTVADGIDVIGNALHDSPAGVDVANATFLISDAVLVEGVLYAYAAFFRSRTPIVFQVWRLVETTDVIVDATYRLVSETRVLPSIRGEEVVGT